MHLHILKNLEDIDVDYMTADPKLMNLMKNEIFQIDLMTLHNLKENTWKDLSDLKLHAQEMEIVNDLKVKASKKNMNGKMTHHWIDAPHDPEFYEEQVRRPHRQARHDMYIHHLVPLTFETTLGWKSTLWPQRQYPDGRIPSGCDRTAVPPRSTHNIHPMVGQERDERVVRVFFQRRRSLSVARRQQPLAVPVPGRTAWIQMRTLRS